MQEILILCIYMELKKNNLKTLKGIFFLFLWQNSENVLERILLSVQNETM